MSTTTKSGLDEKSQKTIADYVGDMVIMENMIEAALDRQLSMGKNDPVFSSVIKKYHDTARDSRERAKAYQAEVGTTVVKPILEKGADLLGAITGMIEKLRAEGLSKNLRDDYTVFNSAAISYTMLHTTAMALGDAKTEQFAAEGLRTYARLVQDINHHIANVVVDELKNDGHTIVNTATPEECRKTVEAIWKETSS
jgi:hypothetical protein